MCLNYTIGGYTYINTTSWYGVKAGVTGWSAEANRHGVRFASDSAGIRYILLGNTSTQWGGYLQVIIPEIIIGYGATPQISSGWEITLIVSNLKWGGPCRGHCVFTAGRYQILHNFL